MSSQQAKPSAAPAPKSSWATLAAASAALPSPKAPVPVKVTPRAPQPAKPAKKTANNAPATTSKKGKDKMKRDPSLPYDRGTPNYKPEKTNVVPTVKEVTERYEIRAESKLEQVAEAVGVAGAIGGGRLIVEERMSESGYCPPESVRALWREKQRIDSFFDEEQEACYYRARNSVFPQDQKGSDKFRNRAGDKLWEVHQDVGLFQPEGGVFFDVCGGPGAWSEVMLSDPRRKWSGFGMTLRLPNTPISDMWYSHLETPDGRWKPLWGADGTGNIYSGKNLDHARDELMRLKRPVSLVMADGGFHVSKNAEGKHMEHLQELYSVRIILGELLACLKCLSEGGSWCCKVFDTFSHLTASVVFITGLCFEQAFLVKPFRSRIVNSERYLVGKKMVARSPALEKLIQHVSRVHESWADDGPDAVHPESLIPIELMRNDAAFFKSFSASVQDLCTKQAMALQQVMDLAVEFRAQEAKK